MSNETEFREAVAIAQMVCACNLPRSLIHVPVTTLEDIAGKAKRKKQVMAAARKYHAKRRDIEKIENAIAYAKETKVKQGDPVW